MKDIKNWMGTVAETNVLAVPKVETLDNVPGGELNLLPNTAWQADLRVEFELWKNSSPSPAFPETLTFYWDGNPIEEKEWTEKIDPDELFVMVEKIYLSEGEHTLMYKIVLSNSMPDESDLLTITIDKTAPVVAPGVSLVFPSEVIDEGVTDAYLIRETDVVAQIGPAYTSIAVGDKILWYWSDSSVGENLVGEMTLTLADLGKPLPDVVFAGQMIRDQGDGVRYAHYRVQDRAGNLSQPSVRVELQVAATPVSRFFPWPTILNAQDERQETVLDPLKSTTGDTVVIPETAVFSPEDKVWVQWGAPDAFGAVRIVAPSEDNPLHFPVPMRAIAAHLNKKLSVYYGVEGLDAFSEITQLKVLKIDPGSYTRIQCEGAFGQLLSYADVKEDGAALTLESWTMMTTDQVIKIEVTGVNNLGAAVELMVLDDHPVSPAELNMGIGANRTVRVDKDFLNTLQRGSQFTIHVYVSFDGGETWPLYSANFPQTYVDFID